MWVAAGVGFAGVLFSFVVAFFPPDRLPVGSPALNVGLVLVGTSLFCAIPLLYTPATLTASPRGSDCHQ